MAYAEKYVTPQATGGGDGLTEGTAWTFAEAVANVATGDRVNIKAGGAYTVESQTLPAVGTSTQYSVWRGYNATIGDLDDGTRVAATGKLQTTNFPSFTMNGPLIPNGYTILQNLSMIGTISTRVVGLISGDRTIFRNVRIENRSDSTACSCVYADNFITMMNCDLVNTEATHGPLALFDADNDLIGCRFEGGASDAALVEANYVNAEACVFYGSTGCDGIHINSSLSANRMMVISHCTFHGLRSAVKIDASVTDVDSPLKFSHNHVTDCVNWINNAYTGGDLVTLEEFNRLRDVTTPRVNCAPEVSSEVTTDDGGPETDYVNAGSGDFRLVAAAAGATAGRYGGSVGAMPANNSGGGVYDPFQQGRIR